MSGEQIRKTAAYILEKKDEIYPLLEYFNPKDIKQGNLVITEELINVGLRDKIIAMGNGKLKDYKITFMYDSILFEGTVVGKGFGQADAKYMVKIEDFIFNPDQRRIEFSYYEDVSGENILSNMALAFIQAKGTVLQAAAAALGKPSIVAGDRYGYIDINQLSIADKIPEDLTLEYKGCDIGKLNLRF